jgi:hypothetical protein
MPGVRRDKSRVCLSKLWELLGQLHVHLPDVWRVDGLRLLYRTGSRNRWLASAPPAVRDLDRSFRILAFIFPM